MTGIIEENIDFSKLKLIRECIELYFKKSIPKKLIL